MPYAAPQDLADWMGKDSPPDGAEQWLRDASMDVDSLLLTAVYDVDEDGMPTKQAVIDTLRDATTAQAEYLIDVGDRTGASAQLTDVKVDKVSKSWATNQYGRVIREDYASRAVQILHQAGLIPGTVRARR
ncbi:hypothetical protein F4561_002670 [Lipingzhangella halophila]|uniref:Uncharacterized protein n=1 Tax=Lipingzhangella halophila TaxID=1783352 RepID=A0A7W7RH95_9ACTN|nr:hypothetical protein [Lipingzhangella halophila]MBB4931850.1 hypothetical protein [Lipingzhangella halophila]